MATDAYLDILARIQRLSTAEQLRLLEELAALVRQQLEGMPRRSLLELQGLGKEAWDAADAQDYVDQERDSWTG